MRQHDFRYFEVFLKRIEEIDRDCVVEYKLFSPRELFRTTTAKKTTFKKQKKMLQLVFPGGIRLSECRRWDGVLGKLESGNLIEAEGEKDCWDRDQTLDCGRKE
jgi:hypothetical protein